MGTPPPYHPECPREHRAPAELGYRPAADDRASGRGHYAGAVALAVAVVAWGWLGLSFTTLRWRVPWRHGEHAWLWAVLVWFVAVAAGVAATREGRPPADSRSGSLALHLAGSLWLTLVALAAVGRR